MDYDQLKARLTIDRMRLDDELIEMPQCVDDAGEGLADAIRYRDNCKTDYGVVCAEVASDMRRRVGAKQPSEAQIKSEIDGCGPIINARRNLDAAEHEVGKWKALVDGFRQKNYSLQGVSDLMRMGYASPTSTYETRKQEISTRRKQLNEAKE